MRSAIVFFTVVSTVMAAVIALTARATYAPIDDGAAPPVGPDGGDTDEVPPFTSHIRALSDDEKRAMQGISWRKGCPIPLRDLRRVALRHHDGAGGHPTGVLVVHRVIADDIVAVFSDLYAQGFVIAHMEGIERYGGSDDESMAANNTSAFNCREMTGMKGVYSLHAYGLAIDVNPLVNPYVKGGRILPKSGSAYVDRVKRVPGMIVPDDGVVRAFRARGFTWGGDFRALKDWQHFEKPRSVLSSSTAQP
jgi:hypothetical protein